MARAGGVEPPLPGWKPAIRPRKPVCYRYTMPACADCAWHGQAESNHLYRVGSRQSGPESLRATVTLCPRVPLLLERETGIEPAPAHWRYADQDLKSCVLPLHYSRAIHYNKKRVRHPHGTWMSDGISVFPQAESFTGCVLCWGGGGKLFVISKLHLYFYTSLCCKDTCFFETVQFFLSLLTVVKFLFVLGRTFRCRGRGRLWRR